MKWLKFMQFAMYMSGWLTKAAEDGVIDGKELAELVEHAATQFGFTIKVKL